MRSLADLLPPPGDEVCIYAPDGERTRSQLLARVDELVGQGVFQRGVAVGVSLPNGGELIASMFAVWQAGAVFVPINPRLTPTEIGRIQEEVVGRQHDEGVAIVSFTSGTTGAPKPVPLLHGRILEGLDQVLSSLRSKPAGGSPMPNLVPVSMSLWAGIYQVLFAFRVGAPVVIMDGFDTLELVDLVRRFGIRSTVLPPAAMVMLADDERINDLSPLKYVRSISAPLSPLQARRFRDRFGISVLNGYGQTELGGEVIGWSAAEGKQFGDEKLGSVGRPHRGVEIRTDASGELWVRTAASLEGGAPNVDFGDRVTGDGWLRTGDVARIDDDGFVWIDGRASDMINRGGLKVHPGEVEEVLRSCVAIADAAVVGMPDERLGEVPIAFCVPADPAAGLPPHGELDRLCREHLAPYKIPVSFEPIDRLPRNEVGKVLKQRLILRP